MVTFDINRSYTGEQVQEMLADVSLQFSDRITVLEDQRNAALNRVAEVVGDNMKLERQLTASAERHQQMVQQILVLQKQVPIKKEPAPRE
jgi:hypothetical protein